MGFLHRGRDPGDERCPNAVLVVCPNFTIFERLLVLRSDVEAGKSDVVDKGEEREKDRAKHQAAQRRVSAVNPWGQLGAWAFRICRDPRQLSAKIKQVLDGAA